MKEIEYYPPAKVGLDPEVARILELLDAFAAKNALVKNVQERQSQQVMYEYEQNRALRRHEELVQKRAKNNTQPFSLPTVIGPDCEKLYPLLLNDEWDYRPGSLLGPLELREILASTIMSELPYAERYTTIVGEDRSGRILALITAKAVNIVRERQGLTKARQVFISGRIGADQVPLFRAQDANDHALVVTEYIKSGGSARRVLGALRRAGFEHISIEAADIEWDSGARSLDSDLLFVGDIDSYTANAYEYLHDRPSMYTGITKENDGSPHAKAVELSAQEREILHETRRSIAHFAEKTVQIYDMLNV